MPITSLQGDKMKKLTLLFFLFMLFVLGGCTKKGPSPNLCPTVCDGLVAYYPFYGDATDKSGNGNDGEVIGAELTKDRNGYPNHAYRFEGGHVLISNPNNFLEGSFSLVANTKLNDIPVVSSGFQEVGILAAEFRYHGISYRIFPKNKQKVLMTLREPSGESSTRAVQVIHPISNPKSYHHFVAVADAGKQKILLYVDGEFKQQLRWTGKIASSRATEKNWVLGKMYPKESDWEKRVLNGNIDEVRLYNRALSSAEVKDLYLFTSAFPPAE
jgi:hypothetical protein